jgi:hypothetical protein
LRLRPDVQVCDAPDAVWLRGGNMTEDLDLDLRKLPGGRRFRLGPDGRLTAAGARVPKGRLPDSGWQSLSAWLKPDPQPAALAGEVTQRVPLTLVRTSHEQSPGVLVTPLETWADYATTAPAVRLRPLRFAASADGRAVVWGDPLPPVPGRRYVEREGVAVPAGWAWSPAVEPAVVRDLLGLAAGDLALFDEDGTYELVAAGGFARATRSGVRATRSEPARPDLTGTSS